MIPHYQKQETLTATWLELKLQLNPVDEVLVVDDHSPDGVPEFNCQCTKVIKPPKLEKHIYRLNTLRNLGLEHAQHDTVLILDPDCVPNPRLLDYPHRGIDPCTLYTGRILRENKNGEPQPDPRDNGGSMYVDKRDKNGAPIWGGCMLMSKYRTRLVGGFNEDFNGAWGCGETDFAAKCYHSGMRLRYSYELTVTHRHHTKNTDGYQGNRELWLRNVEKYRQHLNTFTAYNPGVGVMVITMLRPELVNQCMQSIARTRIPVKTRLVNNGDMGEDTRRICNQWGNRWMVDYVQHVEKRPSVVRNESMRWAKNKGYKYLASIDDDMLVTKSTLVNLVRVLEENPGLYAVSGYQIHSKQEDAWSIGGYIETKNGDIVFKRVKPSTSLAKCDWIGAGCTVHRLDPLVYYDEDYYTGFNDYDWCMKLREQGLSVATSGEAYAYHKHLVTEDGLKQYTPSDEYISKRFNEEGFNYNRELFKKKWGYNLLTRREARSKYGK